LNKKLAAPIYKTEIKGRDHAKPSARKGGTNFADKRRSLGPYSLLEDYGHGVYYAIFRLQNFIHLFMENTVQIHITIKTKVKLPPVLN
jgi:hypothetical protein